MQHKKEIKYKEFLNEDEIKTLILQKKKQGYIYYIYKLWRPDKSQFFYIGKGMNTRLFDHVLAKDSKYSQKYKSNIIKKLKQLGLNVEYIIDSFYLEETDVFKREIELISQYGRLDIKTGCLANMTDGGEGSSGQVNTEELKNKKSKAGKKAWKNKSDEERKYMSDAAKLGWEKRRKNYSIEPWNKGKINVYSEEALKKMSESQRGKTSGFKGKTVTKENKEKLSEMMKLKWNNLLDEERKHSKEHCLRISQSLKGKVRSKEHCLRISKSKKGKKLSEEQKKKLSDAAKLRWKKKKAKVA
tara:strand:+ start:142 stop:1041 length:900 start_codon:yes stop_codon:yes gene_type:complete